MYRAVFTTHFDEIISLLGKKDRPLLYKIEKKIERVLEEPTLGKPLRNVFKNNRRVHIGSFVLVYEIKNEEIRFLDFNHHDKIYKK